MPASSTPSYPTPFGRLTPLRALNLAAPHTWAASVMPCLLGVCICLSRQVQIHPLHAMLLLIICVMFQSSVNTFNDYFDYVKGTDTAEDQLEVDDSVLVNYHINPRSALALAIVYLAIPFAIGAYLVAVTGPIPLVIALVGALAVVTYSAGKTPVSYLPIGEFISGFVMGELIPLGVWSVLAPQFSFLPLLYALPCCVLVGLIMQTNNTCDIEKDIEAGRNTLPVKLGRERSLRLYHFLIVAAIALAAILLAIFNTAAAWYIPFVVLAAFPVVKGLFSNPLLPASRIAAMGAICSLNVIVGAMYSLGLVL